MEAKSLISNNDAASVQRMQELVGLGSRFNFQRDANGNNYMLIEAEDGKVYRVYSDQFAKSSEETINYTIGSYDKLETFVAEVDYIKDTPDNSIQEL